MDPGRRLRTYARRWQWWRQLLLDSCYLRGRFVRGEIGHKLTLHIPYPLPSYSSPASLLTCHHLSTTRVRVHTLLINLKFVKIRLFLLKKEKSYVHKMIFSFYKAYLKGFFDLGIHYLVLDSYQMCAS